jgi:predicted ester cyclase
MPEPTREELVMLHLDGIATGDASMGRRCLHREEVNHMAFEEPPACAAPGLPGFLATSAWLRSAFADLSFELIEMADHPDHSIAHVWMRGRQTGPFVTFPPGQRPVSFPPTGRPFEVRQTHIFRFRDGLHGQHIAVRDDLTMMMQLGHLPPGPAVALRMARWNLTGGARRSVADALEITSRAASGAA